MQEVNHAMLDFLAIKLKAHFGNPIGMWQGLMRDLFRHCDFTARDTCINLQWLVRDGVAADSARMSYFRYDPQQQCRYWVRVSMARHDYRSQPASHRWTEARTLIHHALAPLHGAFEELRMVPHSAQYAALELLDPSPRRADLPPDSQKWAQAEFWHGTVAVDVTVCQLDQAP